jgi:hypothetical protein
MSTPKNESPNFLSNHWPKLIVILLFVTMVIFYNLRINSLSKSHDREKASIEAAFVSKMDSLSLAQGVFNARIFGWSIRSEWMRDNQDNLGQLANRYVRDADVSLVQLIAAENNNLLVSTDKRFEGDHFNFPEGFNPGDTTVREEDQATVVYVPIMGMTERLGTLRIVLK